MNYFEKEQANEIYSMKNLLLSRLA